MIDYFSRAQKRKGTPRKYRPGAVIWDMQEFLEWVYVEQRWVYLRDKPLHPGFIRSMTFDVVLRDVIVGNFRRAELNVIRALPEKTAANINGILQARMIRGRVACFFPVAAISQMHRNWKRPVSEQVASLAYRFEYAYLSHPDGGYSGVLDGSLSVGFYFYSEEAE